eukprot:6197781-Amphidinium_carterae.1
MKTHMVGLPSRAGLPGQSSLVAQHNLSGAHDWQGIIASHMLARLLKRLAQANHTYLPNSFRSVGFYQEAGEVSTVHHLRSCVLCVQHWHAVQMSADDVEGRVVESGFPWHTLLLMQSL